MARGSKPGERRGGRQPGTPNKSTAEQRKAIEESGLTPLDFMMTVLRDEGQAFDKRMWAAEKAAPYVHARLASVEMEGKVDASDTLKEFLARASATGAASIMPSNDGDD